MTKKNELKLNARQHRFCLNILSGMPPQEAYTKAGYSSHPGNLTARPYQIVLDSPAVAKFIAEKRALKEQVILASDTAATIASPNERKQILTELLRAQLVDFLDDGGEPKLSKDTPYARAAREFYHRRKYDRAGQPIITKNIKLTDPIEAIRELNKMDGSYAPSKHMIAQKIDFELNWVERKKRGDNDGDHVETKELPGL